MGKVLSLATRPLKNYNIESRAHDVISQAKPVPAPLHKANLKEAEKLLKENPESLTELMRKDARLDTYLKDIYVKSFDPSIPKLKVEQNPNRPLPVNRRIIEFQEFGHLVPKIVPPGRITLRQVLKLLSNHQGSPETFDFTKESMNYHISVEDMKNIVEHFRVFHIHIPDKKSKLAYGTPVLPHKKIEAGVK